jgi:hypothetical protein
VSLNYINYFAGINYGYTSYARSFENIGNVAAGIHFVNYGEFTQADKTGLKTGTFRAAEYSINLFWSRQINKLFSVGINFKPIMSFLERYSSYGMAFDLGATYHNENKLFSAGLTVKNIGTQLTAYNKKVYEPLPLEILAGMSYKFQHAPFRISVTAHQLQMPGLDYAKNENESQELQTTLDDSENKEENKENWINKAANNLGNFGDEALRHLIFGLEMPIIEDNVSLRFGYNYKRRQEMKISSKVGMVGFSWGFGIRISKFHINYGRATYHLAGPSNHFSINTNLSDFYTRKTKITDN